MPLSHGRSGAPPFRGRHCLLLLNNGEQRVRCGVSRLSLELLEPALAPTKQGGIHAFKQRRARIERAELVRWLIYR